MRIKVRLLIKAVENNQAWLSETYDHMDIERRTKDRTAEGKKSNVCQHISILSYFQIWGNYTKQKKRKKQQMKDWSMLKIKVKK